jgi:hypothetical protein
MAEQEQNLLSQSLLKLEEELTSFGEVHQALKAAHEQLIKAEHEWDRLTKEQQQTALELVGNTKAAIAATHAVTAQAETLARALLPLAKAIESVNFPMRLDKVDMAVSTQALALSSLQGTTERGFNDINGRIGKVDEFMLGITGAVAAFRAAAAERHSKVVTLLIMNLLVIAGVVAFFLARYE